MAVPAPESFEEIAVIMGGPGVVKVQEDGTVIRLDEVEYDPATIYAVKSGQAHHAPNAELAIDRWQTEQRTGTIVGGVATFDWYGPGGGEGDRSSIVFYAATDAVGLAVARITDANLLDQPPRRETIRQLVQNVRQLGAITPGGPNGAGIPIAIAPASAERMPLRFGPGVEDINLPAGHIAEATIDVYRTFAIVRELIDLGPTVPALLTRIALQATGEAIVNYGTNNLQIAGFNPGLVVADRVATVAFRRGGTNIVVPSGKGYSSPDGNGFTAGLLSYSTTLAARLMISDARAADGPFGGTGSASGATDIMAVALRGGVISAFGGLIGNSGSIAFPAFTDIPPGSKIYCACLRNAELGAAPVRPPDGAVLYSRQAADLAWPISWSEHVLPEGVTAWAPDPIAQASGLWVTVVIIASPAE